jgi:hypothetical protein
VLLREMKTKQLTVLLLFLLLSTSLLSLNVGRAATAEDMPDFFVGVDVAYDNITATKELADAIRPYSNLIIIGCEYGIGFRNTTRLNELFDLCQYLVDKGYYFMLYKNIQPGPEIVQLARQFGDRFLGFYAYDEMGGRQLDQAIVYFNESENHVAAADFFVNRLNDWLFNSTGLSFTRPFSDPSEFPLFTSDYALYWYDYKAGYDTVFAQLGWNYSRQLNIALSRGAATVHGKDWGTIVCWKYTQPPYAESAQELYEDMVMSYDNGAKYITVFDSDLNYTHSILTQEHLDAMKRFWEYTQSNPREENNRAAYVLPEGYGYGFRGPKDKIWGLWEADMTSFMLSISVNIMLQRYGSSVDIIYEDALKPGETYGYSDFVLWNNPAAVSDFWPEDWPIPTIEPTLNPTPSASSQETPQPPDQSSIFYVAVGAAAVAVIAAALAFGRRLRKSGSIQP